MLQTPPPQQSGFCCSTRFNLKKLWVMRSQQEMQTDELSWATYCNSYSPFRLPQYGMPDAETAAIMIDNNNGFQCEVGRLSSDNICAVISSQDTSTQGCSNTASDHGMKGMLPEFGVSCLDASPDVGHGKLRVCSQCSTSSTPLWRSGPQGPKSLCNACGIRFKKSQRTSATTGNAERMNETQYLSPSPIKPTTQLKRKPSSSSNSSSIGQSWCPTLDCIEQKGGARNSQVPKRGKRGGILASKKAARRLHCNNDVIHSSSNGVGLASVCISTIPVEGNHLPQSRVCIHNEIEYIISVISKQNALREALPKEEEEAALLLMALSYNLVHA